MSHLHAPRPIVVALASICLFVAGIWLMVATLPEATPASICETKPDNGSPHPPADYAWRTDPDVFIAHGGGGIDGQTYTNSVEAVAEAIRRGYRMVELDLLVTTDGHLVAAHDWKSFRERTGRTPASTADQAMSLTDFRAKKIDERFTPMAEQTIRDIFTHNPNLILVTDKINDFSRLVRALPFQDRIFVEVFSIRDYRSALATGIKNPMLSVANLADSADFILDNPIHHIAISMEQLDRCPGAAEKILASGKRIFAFTSNDAETMRRHVGIHASAIYTDFWNVRTGQCDSPHCPQTPLSGS